MTNSVATPKRGSGYKKQERQIIKAEALLTGEQLAGAMGMTYDNLAKFHLQRLLERGLKRVDIEGGVARYTASSWNKLVDDAITDGKPI